MKRLGYDRWVAQGGDWGGIIITKAIGGMQPAGCAAIHLNLPMTPPDPGNMPEPTPAEQAMLANMRHYSESEFGYAKLQSTRPQTIGYGLADSPVGQAAWIYEKLHAWSDHGGDVEDILSKDEILDNITLYWLPNAGASSARLYFEGLEGAFRSPTIEIPVGVSNFPREAFRASRRWAERYIRNIIHWNELDRGGHFAAFEQPGLFVDELRACFRTIR